MKKDAGDGGLISFIPCKSGGSMKRLKKWKKVIILLAVIGSLVAARILLFESVRVPYKHLRFFPNYEKYKTYILFEGKFTTKSGFLIRSIHESEYIFMFQWQYDKLTEEIRRDLYAKLDEVVEQYQSVSGYAVNEKERVIDMYHNSYAQEVSEKVNGRSLYDVQEKEIGRISYLLSVFTRNEGEYTVCWWDESRTNKFIYGR